MKVRKALLIKANWIGNDGKNIIHSYEDWIVPAVNIDKIIEILGFKE